jgi:hypothetical protein
MPLTWLAESPSTIHPAILAHPGSYIVSLSIFVVRVIRRIRRHCWCMLRGSIFEYDRCRLDQGGPQYAPKKASCVCSQHIGWAYVTTLTGPIPDSRRPIDTTTGDPGLVLPILLSSLGSSQSELFEILEDFVVVTSKAPSALSSSRSLKLELPYIAFSI